MGVVGVIWHLKTSQVQRSLRFSKHCIFAVKASSNAHLSLSCPTFCLIFTPDKYLSNLVTKSSISGPKSWRDIWCRETNDTFQKSSPKKALCATLEKLPKRISCPVWVTAEFSFTFQVVDKRWKLTEVVPASWWNSCYRVEVHTTFFGAKGKEGRKMAVKVFEAWRNG